MRLLPFRKPQLGKRTLLTYSQATQDTSLPNPIKWETFTQYGQR